MTTSSTHTGVSAHFTWARVTLLLAEACGLGQVTRSGLGGPPGPHTDAASSVISLHWALEGMEWVVQRSSHVQLSLQEGFSSKMRFSYSQGKKGKVQIGEVKTGTRQLF